MQDRLTLLLVGNPNAGKSTLFNRLTKGHARVGNWHGVTVGALEKEARLGGRSYLVCDIPGIYSLDAMSMEERLARERIDKERDAVILFVCECAGLMRALPLFDTVTSGRRTVLILTKHRQLLRAGGGLEREELSRILGVPVLLSEERGFKQKLSNILQKMPAPAAERGPLSPSCYRPPRQELSRADNWLLRGFVCIPLWLMSMLLVFLLTFAPHLPGDVMKGAVEDFFDVVLGGLAERVPSPIVRSLLKDGILHGLGSVLSFLPQISMLFLFLIIFEESGLLSRLAYLTDGLFAGVGLNGRAVFSLLMGYGCTAAAILTTRGLDDKRLQRRAILSLPYIPCSAKLPVFLTLTASFFKNPFPAVAGLYVLGTLLSLLVARLLRGKQPPFVMELAPLQLPSPIFVLKSLLFQVKQFIIKTATVILAFLLVSWLLSSFDFSLRLVPVERSMLSVLCGGLKWLFAPAGMADWRIAYAALSGLVAKENVAGTLRMFFGQFPYGGASAAAFAVFILTCSPCVSAVAATAREVGWGRALLYAALQTLSALLLCYLTYFLLKGGIVPALLFAAPVVAFCLMRELIESIHRTRKHHTQKVYGRALRTGVLCFSHAAEGQGHPRQRAEDKSRRSAQKGG